MKLSASQITRYYSSAHDKCPVCKISYLSFLGPNARNTFVKIKQYYSVLHIEYFSFLQNSKSLTNT